MLQGFFLHGSKKSRKEEEGKHVKRMAKLFEFTVCKVKRT